MVDERMSEEEIARLEATEGARMEAAEALGQHVAAALVRNELHLLAELRRERARADAATARLDAFARAIVKAATGIAQPEASLAFLLDGLPGEVAGLRRRADEIAAVRDLVGALDGEETFDAVRAFVHEHDQLRRDRERERDIAARRERAACVSHVRQRGVESKDGMVLDVTTDIANEIEEGLHHG